MAFATSWFSKLARFRQLRWLGGALVIWSSLACALEPTRPTFHLDQGNTSINGVGFDDAGASYPVPGSGTDRTSFISYSRVVSGHTLIWPDAASVVMWVTYPQGVDYAPHDFLQVYAHETSTSNDGGFIFVQNQESGYDVLAETGWVWSWGSGPQRPFTAGVPIGDFQWVPQVQHQVALIWSPNRGLRVTIDGGTDPKLVAAFKDLRLQGFPSQLAPHFYLGDSSGASPCNPGPCTRPRLDRVDIYDHAISDDLVKALWACPTGICPASSDPHPVLRYSIHPSRNTLTARVEVDDLADTGDRIVFSLLQGGSVVGPSQTAPIRRSAAEVTLSTSALSPGDFELHATIIPQKGPRINVPSQKISKPPTSAWAGASLGLGSTPAGWTPLRASHEANGSIRIACTGRSYLFKAGPQAGLISEIQSAGEQTLAHPIDLVVTDGSGQKIAWSDSQLNIVSRTPQKVVVRRNAKSRVGLELTATTTIEDDGIAWLRLSFDRVPAAMKIASVWLDVPVVPVVAKYVYRSNPMGYPAPTPTANAKAWQDSLAYVGTRADAALIGSFSPFIWLGNDERGLFWFAESDRYWSNRYNQSAGSRPIEFVTTSDAVIERFNVVIGWPENFTPPNVWQFEFGIQPTPIKKAVSPRAVSLQTGTLGRVTSPLLYPVLTSGPNSYAWTPIAFGYPVPYGPADFKKTVTYFHSQRELVMPYALLTELVRPDPHQLAEMWNWYQAEWRTTVGQEEGAWYVTGNGTEVETNVPMEAVDPSSRAWQDFIVYRSAQLLNQYGVDGFYHDQTLIYPRTTVRDPDRPDAVDENGVRYPIYPVRDYRDLYRRAYSVTKKAAPNGFSVGHGVPILPALGYHDAYLEGEEVRSAIEASIKACVDFSYFDAMTSPAAAQRLDRFRTQYMGRQWGLTPYFEAYSVSDTVAYPPDCISAPFKTARAREAFALGLLHDVGLLTSFLDPTEIQRDYGAIQQLQACWSFSFDDMQFSPYFASSAAVEILGAPDVFASAYVGSGVSLIIVVNSSTVANAAPTPVTMRLTSAVSPGGIVTVYDQVGNVLAAQGPREYSVAVGPRDYAMFVVTSPSAVPSCP